MEECQASREEGNEAGSMSLTPCHELDRALRSVYYVLVELRIALCIQNRYQHHNLNSKTRTAKAAAILDLRSTFFSSIPVLNLVLRAT